MNQGVAHERFKPRSLLDVIILLDQRVRLFGASVLTSQFTLRLLEADVRSGTPAVELERAGARVPLTGRFMLWRRSRLELRPDGLI